MGYIYQIHDQLQADRSYNVRHGWCVVMGPLDEFYTNFGGKTFQQKSLKKPCHGYPKINTLESKEMTLAFQKVPCKKGPP